MLKQEISRVILIRSIYTEIVPAHSAHNRTCAQKFSISMHRFAVHCARDSLHQAFLNYLKRLATVIDAPGETINLSEKRAF